MEPIEAALQRIAVLLQQQLDQAESHMEEVRTRDARFTASDEAWKEEMRGHYRKHDTIEQERLTLDRENAARMEEATAHAFANQEQWRKEDVERQDRQEQAMISMFAGRPIKVIHQQEDEDN